MVSKERIGKIAMALGGVVGSMLVRATGHEDLASAILLASVVWFFYLVFGVIKS
jgi:hypothetical protein